MATLTTLSQIYATYKLIQALTTKTKTATIPSSVAFTAWQPVQWKSIGTKTESELIGIKTGIYDSNNSNYYFFDAVFREDHLSVVRMTEHPVQTGANIVDHAYLMPATLTMEIGMSDAMQSLVSGEWGVTDGIGGKSVNAYQKLLSLQQSRLPLTVHTRLNKYENMVIEQISVQDDYKTQNGLRATITFRQLLVAVVSTTSNSADSQTTGSTSNGNVNTESTS